VAMVVWYEIFKWLGVVIVVPRIFFTFMIAWVVRKKKTTPFGRSDLVHLEAQITIFSIMRLRSHWSWLRRSKCCLRGGVWIGSKLPRAFFTSGHRILEFASNAENWFGFPLVWCWFCGIDFWCWFCVAIHLFLVSWPCFCSCL
jgi:hypothetical protein